jgi:hypothetical protein
VFWLFQLSQLVLTKRKVRKLELNWVSKSIVLHLAVSRM